jgi:ATP-dependent RNA helicase DeaD
LPAPTAADVLRAADERLAAELTAPKEGAPEPAPRLRALAEQLLATMDPRDLVTALLARTDHAGPCPPADVTPILPPARGDRAPHTVPPPRGRGRDRDEAPGRDGGRDGGRDAGPPDDGAAPGFVPFRINWGERHGADPRRLLAMVCRRGGIRGSEVGAIRIGTTGSTFQVAASVAEAFAGSVKKPDTRDPKIRIDAIAAAAPGTAAAEPAPSPPPVRRKVREERVPARGHAHASRSTGASGPPTPRSPGTAPPAAGPEAAPLPASGQAPPKRRPRWAE